jgi:hypothetical protein
VPNSGKSHVFEGPWISRVGVVFLEIAKTLFLLARAMILNDFRKMKFGPPFFLEN